MAQFELVDLDLDGGLNQAADPVAMPKGDFARLDNCVFDVGIRKRVRHGHIAKDVWDPTADGPYSAITGEETWLYGHGFFDPDYPYTLSVDPRLGPTRGVFARDQEVVVWDGWRSLSYIPQDGGALTDDDTSLHTWARHGGDTGGSAYANKYPVEPTPVCTAKETPYTSLGWSGQRVDVARGKHRTASVWRDGGNIYFVLKDNGGAHIARYVITPTDPEYVRVFYSVSPGGAGTFFVIYTDNTDTAIFGMPISELAPAVPSPTTLWGSAASPQVFDAAPCQSGGIALVFDDGSSHLRHVYFYPAGTTSADNLTITTAPIANSPVSISVHPSGDFLVAWMATGGAVKARFYDKNRATLGAEIAVGSVTTAYRVACSIQYLKTVDDKRRGCVAFSDSNDDSTDLIYVYEGATTGSARTIGDCVLTHQGFRVGDNPLFVVGYVRTGTLQPVYAVISADRTGLSTRPRAYPVAGLARGNASPSTADRIVGSVTPSDVFTTINNTTQFLAVRTARQVVTEDSITLKDFGISLVELDFLPALRHAQAGRSVYVAGGVVQEYDGYSFRPAGHLLYPEITLTASNGAGSLTSSSTYTYRVYLLARNGQGEFVRSAAITKTVELGATDDTVTVGLSMVPLNYREDYQWEIYRSEANGALLKLVAQTDPVSLSSTYLAARYTDLSYTDNSADSAILSAAVDPAPAYTTSGFGVLDAVAPPNCEIIAYGKDRVWFAGGGLPAGQVAYTRLYDAGECPLWNEALVVQVDRSANPVTGLGFFGEAAIVLKETSLYYFGGDGPDNAGSGDFDSAHRLPGDEGCVSPDSVVLLPYGLAYQARSGIRAVSGGFSVVALGDPVDPGVAAGGLRRAVATGNRARFSDESDTYVLDYTSPDKPRWTRWTYGALACSSVSGHALVAPANQDPYGKLWVESEDVHLDGGSPYKMLLDFGWVVPDTTGSWGRYKWWTLAGKYYSEHKLEGTLQYDYQDRAYPWSWNPADQYNPYEGNETVDVGASGLEVDRNGQDAYWQMEGNNAWYYSRPYTFRRSFTRQRAGTFRLVLWNTETVYGDLDAPGAPKGASFGISGIAFRGVSRTENGTLRAGERNFG